MSRKPENFFPKRRGEGEFLNNTIKSISGNVIIPPGQVPVAKEVTAERRLKHLHSPSFTVLDIVNVEDHVSFSNIDKKKLSEIVKDKNLDLLDNHFGGTEGLVKVLQTDSKSGINGDSEDISHRRSVFGSNMYDMPPSKGITHFVVKAFKNLIIIILLVCAALTLAFGIKQHGVEEGWYEGGSIFIAVTLVVVVSAASNFKQSRQFDKLLSKVRNNIYVEVVRDGRRQGAPIFDIVVGDIVYLKIGDEVPADGVFLNGYSLEVDESSMTGESGLLVEVNRYKNPFLLSGVKVANGFGHMLVTSVGMNTDWGPMMSSITLDTDERIPLQERLDKLRSTITKIGLTMSALVPFVMLLYGNRKREFDDGKQSKGQVVAAAFGIVVATITEGLTLAVTLTLAYSMKGMMADRAMVRKLSACETIGSATTICTGKTGTLTLNMMRVTEFCLDQEPKLDYEVYGIAPNVLQLLYQGIGLNTTGTVYRSTSGADPEFSGSPTEKAILSWAVLKLGMDMEKVKRKCFILHVEAFNSEKKRSGVMIRKIRDNTTHVHWKGAAEMILAACSNYYDSYGTIRTMGEGDKNIFKRTIQDMAAKGLRCIAFAHKEIAEDGNNPHQLLREDSLIFLAVVGIKDPCRPGMYNAIRVCKNAGVKIKMITGDNVSTATSIAIDCGILDAGSDLNTGAVVEGVEFRNYTEEERLQKVERIRVMARSSPFDKLLMVQTLKMAGHVVAVTGDGNAPALKEADISLSLGIHGTEVAKWSSDIVILDDNFVTVAVALRWGRCVYSNIQKFIQFHLTVNIAAVVINFISAVSSGKVPLTAVKLLWVNLIMDTLGPLALVTERPTDELLDKPPIARTAPLITNVMWRNLLAQALYQITILLVIQFKGKSIFNVDDDKVIDTLVFNTFVLCQIFNEFNARKLEKKNVFKGITRNRLFLRIVGFILVLQVIMVEYLNKFADTANLNLVQWFACVGIAAVSWPIGWFVKDIPVSDKPFFNF